MPEDLLRLPAEIAEDLSDGPVGYTSEGFRLEADDLVGVHEWATTWRMVVRRLEDNTHWALEYQRRIPTDGVSDGYNYFIDSVAEDCELYRVVPRQITVTRWERPPTPPPNQRRRRKLTAEQVEEILVRYSRYSRTAGGGALAREYGVSPQYVAALARQEAAARQPEGKETSDAATQGP